MAARSVNSAIAKEISQEVDKFYEKLELRYYSSIPRDDVTQKLALQDLFKSASTKEPGRGGTSHLTNFDETWPV